MQYIDIGYLYRPKNLHNTFQLAFLGKTRVIINSIRTDSTHSYMDQAAA